MEKDREIQRWSGSQSSRAVLLDAAGCGGMFETEQSTEGNILEMIKEESSGALTDRLPQKLQYHWENC